MLKIYNTLARKKEEFKSINPGKVGMYNCGPTVYDFAHIGNLKTYIATDVLRRYLEYSGYEVRQIMNITDVGHLTNDDTNQADTGEDKMMKGALREKKTPQEIAEFYTEKFFGDLERLNIEKAAYYPRATAHVAQMIKMTEALIEKGLAYEVNGNVFYSVEKFPQYGKLSGIKLDELKAGARLEEHPDKKHPYDFSLWLKAPKEHILKWESPWSLGYPGWHIECSAMSIEYLGETMDIHTGGEDHIFPHHENEIAQSEGYTGKEFARYWMHTRFLLVDGQKMSKSKGNFYALKDILAKGYDPMHFRLFAMSGLYRTQVSFSWTALDQAKTNLEKIANFERTLGEIAAGGKAAEAPQDEPVDFAYIYLKRFEEAMDDDLNTPLALSVLYELITETNKLIAAGKIGSAEAKVILSVWNKMNRVFGLVLTEGIGEVSQEAVAVAEERKAARIGKDFQKSDELRDKLGLLGYSIEDLPDNEYKLRKK
ncbi:MAG: cysteine--tRNA ligase [Candidatus Moranbacteria bacterium]|nr:cysteine--tRNA ligase [Candidatus Moranbacteria bacterium]